MSLPGITCAGFERLSHRVAQILHDSWGTSYAAAKLLPHVILTAFLASVCVEAFMNVVSAVMTARAP